MGSCMSAKQNPGSKRNSSSSGDQNSHAVQQQIDQNLEQQRKQQEQERQHQEQQRQQQEQQRLQQQEQQRLQQEQQRLQQEQQRLQEEQQRIQVEQQRLQEERQRIQLEQQQRLQQQQREREEQERREAERRENPPPQNNPPLISMTLPTRTNLPPLQEETQTTATTHTPTENHHNHLGGSLDEAGNPRERGSTMVITATTSPNNNSSSSSNNLGGNPQPSSSPGPVRNRTATEGFTLRQRAVQEVPNVQPKVLPQPSFIRKELFDVSEAHKNFILSLVEEDGIRTKNLSWTELRTKAFIFLNAKQIQFDRLHYLIQSANPVDDFLYLIEWFSPLFKEDDETKSIYTNFLDDPPLDSFPLDQNQNSLSTSSTNVPTTSTTTITTTTATTANAASSASIPFPQVIEGYKLSEISNFVSPKWFHGFLSAKQAQKLVAAQPIGSYLFRFSSEVGQFAFCFKDGDEQIKHWRIIRLCKNRFSMSNFEFASFEEFITVYKDKPLTDANTPLVHPIIRVT